MSAAATADPHADTGAWLWAVVDPVRLEILRVLAASRDATVTGLARRSGATPRTLRRHLDALVAVGVVCEQPGNADGFTPGRPPSRFSLDPRLRPSVAGAFGLRDARLRATQGGD